MCFSFLSWLGNLVFIINLQYIRLRLLLLYSLCLSPSRYAVLHLLIWRAIYVSSLAREFMWSIIYDQCDLTCFCAFCQLSLRHTHTRTHTRTHSHSIYTHTHTYIFIYIYIHICVYKCTASAHLHVDCPGSSDPSQQAQAHTPWPAGWWCLWVHCSGLAPGPGLDCLPASVL